MGGDSEDSGTGQGGAEKDDQGGDQNNVRGSGLRESAMTPRYGRPDGSGSHGIAYVDKCTPEAALTRPAGYGCADRVSRRGAVAELAGGCGCRCGGGGGSRRCRGNCAALGVA